MIVSKNVQFLRGSKKRKIWEQSGRKVRDG